MDDKAEINKIRILAQNGSVKEALAKANKLKKTKPSPKLQKLITKLELYLVEYSDAESSDEEDQMVHVENNFYVYKGLCDRLYPYQIDGVKFLWNLHQRKKGCVIGDDMGLGKTIQIIAFLSGLFDLEKIKTVLLVLPISVIPNWEKEFEDWAPGITVLQYYGTDKLREKNLNRIRLRGGVLITSYGLIRTKKEALGEHNGRQFVWDYVILDEAHAIKNPTCTSKAMHTINSKHRVALTGTPIQNNLMELWALFDFVHCGTLLGTAKTFKLEYETPIVRSREKCATAGQKELGAKISNSLQRRIEPYFLRRTKAQVLKDDENKENVKCCKPKQLTQKNDFIVWLYLTPTQEKIYRDFLQLDEVKELLMTTKSPLVQLNILKKICDHPRLLAHNACVKLGLSGDEDENSVWNVKNVPSKTLVSESNKISFTLHLVSELEKTGHRCLIFSQSRKMLDILQKIFTETRLKFLRMDGTIHSLDERAKTIKTFQEDRSYIVFLLTTQVGGVGITLTAADRVIIIDPSWNPATDAQAVDRAFRIGQEKPVVVYRLITCSTIEEKIYRRQIFKDSIIRQATGDTKDPFRYFTKEELRSLFILEDTKYSKTQKQLEEIHRDQRKSYPYLDNHIAFLHSLDIFGLSDHDTMFNCHEDEAQVSEMDQNYIAATVEKAQDRLEKETDLVRKLNENEGVNQYMKFTQVWPEPFQRQKTVQKDAQREMEDMNADVAAGTEMINKLLFANSDDAEEDMIESDNKFSDDELESIKNTSHSLKKWHVSKSADDILGKNKPSDTIVIDSDDELPPAFEYEDGNDVNVVHDSYESLPDTLSETLSINDTSRRRSCSSQMHKRRSMFNSPPRSESVDLIDSEDNTETSHSPYSSSSDDDN